MTAQQPTAPDSLGAPIRVPNILSIAGTDPTGGAGIQADLKSIAATGGYGMAVATALVAQNTQGVRSIHCPPTEFLADQLNAVSDDVRIDAVKIGMLFNSSVVKTVHDWLVDVAPPIVVLDPVMVATSGDRLLDAGAEQAVRDLLSVVDIVTPNLPELAVLAQAEPARDWATTIDQALAVSARYSVRVLAKGGHLSGANSPDALVDANGATPVTEFTTARVNTVNTHGTGCSLSSAIATIHARTNDWPRTVSLAKRWLTGALEAADDLDVGTGHGPINHFATLWSAAATSATDQGTNPAPPRAIIPAAGSVAETWWNRIAPIRAAILELPFIRELGSGDLDEQAFRYYLTQDALYLRVYSRVLARASELSPTPQEQVFWANNAIGCIEGELELHRDWLGTDLGSAAPAVAPEPNPVTTGYLDHLIRAGESGDYATVVSALLPCFWLYQDVGVHLHGLNHAGHNYASWLDTYADEAFAESTLRAIGYLERALEQKREQAPGQAPDHDRADGVEHESSSYAGDNRADALLSAFVVSSEWELKFFAMAHDAVTHDAVTHDAETHDAVTATR